MKIAVIGAGGKSGSKIMAEALARDHEVTAFVRDAGKVAQQGARIVEKDVFDLVYHDLADQDVIVSALGFWTEETLPNHKKAARHLLEILDGKPNRLIFVGGAGSLFVDDSHTTRLFETPDFPEAHLPIALHMKEALDMIQENDRVNWTYLSPAVIFDVNGEATGRYLEGKEEVLRDERGKSYISYADYAVALLDEAERGAHVRERYTVRN